MLEKINKTTELRNRIAKCKGKPFSLNFICQGDSAIRKRISNLLENKEIVRVPNPDNIEAGLSTKNPFYQATDKFQHQVIKKRAIQEKTENKPHPMPAWESVWPEFFIKPNLSGTKTVYRFGGYY